MTKVSTRKVILRVLESWSHTLIALTTMVMVMTIMGALTARFLGARLLISVLMGTAGTALLVWALSEVIVNLLGRARVVDVEEFPRFVAVTNDLFSKHWRFLPRPRLYILKFGGLPNACAYGIGIPGLCAIGITAELYQLLDEEELKAVVAHELGHLRSFDVGLMTVIVLITGGAEELSKRFLGGRTALGKGPFALAVGALMYLFAKFVIPVGRSAISQERERAADALGSLFVGTPVPLMTALGKLEHARIAHGQGGASETILTDLFISHPRMATRLNALKTLAAGEDTEEGARQ